MPCLFDRDDIETDTLLVGLINLSDRGRIIKNDEVMGFITPVNTKPFQDLVAAVMMDRENKGQQKQTTGEWVSRDPRETPQKAASDEKFLSTFQYGEEMSKEQLERK